MTVRPVRRALLSVSDKRGIVDFAKRLTGCEVEIISSGGTAETLREAGVGVRDVSEVTGSPEILGGRVKTLHPRIHGGILAIRDSSAHSAELDAQQIDLVDLVVANLYPFEATVAVPGVSDADAVENIDIGGPAMIRAAAKNYAWVGVVTAPEQYDEVAEAVEAGGLDAPMRERLARAAFARTAEYDAAITAWMSRDEPLPGSFTIVLDREDELRYGENPGQGAALYRTRGASPWWSTAIQHQGKPMSFNNYADAEAAWALACDLSEGSAVVVKHTNPCGVASRHRIADAVSAAWECDPLSAFGGVVALHGPVDAATAEFLSARFVEVVVAAAVDDAAIEVLSRKPGMRVLEATAPHRGDADMRRVEDGLLVQDRLDVSTSSASWDVVSSRPPTPQEAQDLEFAWVVAAHTKSNAVVVAKEGAGIGVGAGDQSRVGAAERALARAGARAMGAVAASDGFLPFRDGLDVLAEAGVTALVEPGGSRRDPEVVAAADERDMALLFTNERQFRH
ncbi:MAG: bifunctional phosphoribosylaminoimidazolecarboxamide formyltransferase/IMP cyclohydrolase [Acidimicrobiia bacterium]